MGRTIQLRIINSCIYNFLSTMGELICKKRCSTSPCYCCNSSASCWRYCSFYSFSLLDSRWNVRCSCSRSLLSLVNTLVTVPSRVCWIQAFQFCLRSFTSSHFCNFSAKVSNCQDCPDFVIVSAMFFLVLQWWMEMEQRTVLPRLRNGFSNCTVLD